MGPISRRLFLQRAAQYSALGSAAGLAANLSSFNAFAANTSGYRALVCVFFFGGLDGHDVVIPFDQASYDEYAASRSVLINREEGYLGSRDRENLLPLSGVNVSGREYAMPLELQPLHELFESGDAAIIGNVGPIVAPLNRDQFRSGAVPTPPRLFSHNDQQSIWQASAPEGAPTGWGGRLADILLESGANPNATFTNISVSGNTPFLTGNVARQFQVGSSGPLTYDAIDRTFMLGTPSSFSPAIEAHLLDTGGATSNLFQQDIVNVARLSVNANAELASALAAAPAPHAPVPTENPLASQLAVVASIISQQASLGVGRQIFFVSAGGFDTHRNQPAEMVGLQTGFAAAIRYFYDELAALGRQNEVTTFTASDFGRTLQVNAGAGTDHGWGGHHFVIGGGVNGGQILGDIPPAVFEHEFDSGQGRLIPTTAVDQYAAALGGWFGLTPSEQAEAVPGIANFDRNQLDGLFL